MDRKLTEKEIAFLMKLRKLMLEYNALLSTDGDCVCIDVGYRDGSIPIAFPDPVVNSCDIDDLISINS